MQAIVTMTFDLGDCSVEELREYWEKVQTAEPDRDRAWGVEGVWRTIVEMAG